MKVVVLVVVVLHCRYIRRHTSTNSQRRFIQAMLSLLRNRENMGFTFRPVDGADGHFQSCCKALLSKILKKAMRGIFAKGA